MTTVSQLRGLLRTRELLVASFTHSSRVRILVVALHTPRFVNPPYLYPPFLVLVAFLVRQLFFPTVFLVCHEVLTHPCHHLIVFMRSSILLLEVLFPLFEAEKHLKI